MKKDYTKLFLGLIIVAIGTSLLFSQFGLVVFGLEFTDILGILWPLIFIVIGISILINGKVQPGLVITIIGSLFLLNALFDVNIWSLLWPIIIITVGLAILLKGSGKTNVNKSQEGFIAINAMFTGIQKKVTSKEFKGANIFTMFGATELDLRKANLDKDGAEIDITTLFGGVEIRVPEKVVVQSEGSAFLGAWEEKTSTNPDDKSPTLRIKGSAMFGGVEIK